MAGELNFTWALTVDKEPPMSAPIGMNVFNQKGNISSGKYAKGTVTASHTAPVAVPLGEVAGNCGYFGFRNPSETETVNILSASNGTVWAELGPLDSGCLKIPAAATPYAEAAGSTDVDIEYTLWAR